jgi:hypothetical protein
MSISAGGPLDPPSRVQIGSLGSKVNLDMKPTSLQKNPVFSGESTAAASPPTSRGDIKKNLDIAKELPYLDLATTIKKGEGALSAADQLVTTNNLDIKANLVQIRSLSYLDLAAKG